MPAPELNPILQGDASAIITTMHACLSGGKIAGQIIDDIAGPRPSLVVENFRRALELRIEAPPAEIAERLSPFERDRKARPSRRHFSTNSPASTPRASRWAMLAIKTEEQGPYPPTPLLFGGSEPLTRTAAQELFTIARKELVEAGEPLLSTRELSTYRHGGGIDKAVEDDQGFQWPSLRAAARAWGLDPSTAQRRVKRNFWRYIQ